MKMNDIRKMEDKEIDKKIDEIRKELMVIMTKKSSGANPDNPGKIRAMKRDIARLMTEKNRRVSIGK